MVLLVGLLVATAPIPFTILSTRPPLPVTELITVEGAPRDLSGTLLASSVGSRQATPGLALWALVSPSRSILPMTSGDDADSGTTVNRSFNDGVHSAAAVSLRLTGHEVRMSTRGLRVTHIQGRAPADGLLRPGDVLLRANGRELFVPYDLRAATRGPASTPVSMQLLRNGRQESVDVATGPLPDAGGTGIGVRTTTVESRIQLPAGITVEGTDVGDGGSAGLILALALYDRFADAPVLKGLRVAGTGGLDLQGGVHSVEGIEHKVRAAHGLDIDVFLVPESQYDVALAASNGRVSVTGVATVNDALRVLENLKASP